jgi:hypothetical protein
MDMHAQGGLSEGNHVEDGGGKGEGNWGWRVLKYIIYNVFMWYIIYIIYIWR